MCIYYLIVSSFVFRAFCCEWAYFSMLSLNCFDFILFLILIHFLILMLPLLKALFSKPLHASFWCEFNRPSNWWRIWCIFNSFLGKVILPLFLSCFLDASSYFKYYKQRYNAIKVIHHFPPNANFLSSVMASSDTSCSTMNS